MKRFAAAFFVIALFLSNLAAHAASATFVSRRGEIFQLILDGRVLNGPGSSQVRIDRLPAGPHNVEFRVPLRRGFLTYCTRVFLDRGFESNFVMSPPGKHPNFQLRKVNQMPLLPPPNCAPAPHGNNFQFDDYDYYHGDSGSYNQSDNGAGYGNNQGNIGPNSGNQSNNYDTDPGYTAPSQSYMSSYDVDMLVESMSKKNLDASKFEIAKQAISNSSILAEDVKRIMHTFQFENSRLDFAKYAYPHVYDQQNFYRVYDAFQFETSITDMQRWMKK